jgi:phospholipase/carboxylesterase
VTKLSGPMLPPRSGKPPRQVVVLLHGYGSDGNDLIGLAPHWQAVLPNALFVSPNAPIGTPMGGYQWFAIDWAGDRLASRQTGVTQARPILEAFLVDLWTQTGLTAADTILAGFSQGAMMALHTGLSLSEPLLGIVAFSGALLPPQGLTEGALAKVPVCLVHGDSDDVVDPVLSAEADHILRTAGYDVRYHSSPGVGHGIAPDGLAFATDFIGRLVK